MREREAQARRDRILLDRRLKEEAHRAWKAKKKRGMREKKRREEEVRVCEKRSDDLKWART